ncbi:MAG: hypothetical protein HYU03_02345 [Thaumarchaeota archaeon]|nr:hypothetical protein [Nitrososphaerota archaeon]MBI3022836.1 hypothetical protein [Nitrososphaerota archaeon]MCS4539515.1 hypothetical protein [Nitrososphaerota archaeon]
MSDPLSKFSALLRVCIDEEGSSRPPALILLSALSLATGLLSSGLTAYLLMILSR